MPTAKCVAVKTLVSSVTKTLSLEIYYFQVNVISDATARYKSGIYCSSKNSQGTLKHKNKPVFL